MESHQNFLKFSERKNNKERKETVIKNKERERERENPPIDMMKE